MQDWAGGFLQPDLARLDRQFVVFGMQGGCV
jgi:hypothetical protein